MAAEIASAPPANAAVIRDPQAGPHHRTIL